MSAVRIGLGHAMASALYLKFRGFVWTYPRRYEAAPAGFAQLAEVSAGERAILGRAEDATVVFRTPDISRRHCLIDGTQTPFVIADLGSTSGTRLNGRLLSEPMALSPGDEIGIGQVLLLVHEHAPPTERRMLDDWARDLSSRHRDRRWAAAEALSSFGAEGRGAIATLVRALADEHPPVRRYAARALGLIGHDLAIGVLTDKLDEPDALVAIEIVRALGRFEDRAADAVDPLADLLSHPRLRHAASRSLARIGEAAVGALRDALHDDDPHVIQLATQALADIGEPAAPAIDQLIHLTQHRDPDVRRDVLRALAKMGPRASQAVAVLFQVIERDDDERVRAWATSALGAAARDTRWEAKAVAELTRALEDPGIRFSAIVALGRIGPAARVAITSLRRIAAGPRELYAKAAREALVTVDVRGVSG